MTAFSPLNSLPALLNHVLAQEPWACNKLAAHAGKTARFDAGVFALSLTVEADGLLSRAADDASPQVTIRVKAGDIPLILQHRARAFSYVMVEGDAEFASTISQVAQSLKWDAEEDLSKLVGDIAAVRLVGVARRIAQAAVAVPQQAAAHMAEYLVEEKPVLVSQLAMSEFGAEVARLRDGAERLIKRIEKIEGTVP
jgi:ubiquinone biosynthesis protein UbiJ